EVSGGASVPQLIVTYTLDANYMGFATPQGFNTADHFFHYLRDAFDVLYVVGGDAAMLLSSGLHWRVLGGPGRLGALQG
ncbi:allantoinase, partial [Burkholderia pseudomallei]